ncbi:olfactory receptor 9I1-like [Dermochelys coriacea]|uniref:olfactory receptor 9I1-like n=1 Tax=Dermochelys coriacea TaxID=27794 RepID=UPI0018E72903|nr:olfactory receptor 9I1-like [Dermochelys coriacea]
MAAPLQQGINRHCPCSPQTEIHTGQLGYRIHLIKKEEGRNHTFITEFILLGFGNVPQLHVLLFLLFLVIYVMTMARNTLIIVLVVVDQHLHTPMYFFLRNLSCLETCYTSAILLRILANLLTADRTISILFFLMISVMTMAGNILIVVLVVADRHLHNPFYIISTILRIPSIPGRQKTFSTGSSHLTVVTIFYVTLMTIYILPNTGALRAPNKVFSVLYTILTPLLNPLIYSLRNKEVKEALRRALQKGRI